MAKNDKPAKDLGKDPNDEPKQEPKKLTGKKVEVVFTKKFEGMFNDRVFRVKEGTKATVTDFEQDWLAKRGVI